ncbi:MAG: regulatory protein RecX [Spirochaetaceae bacterium]|nr:regulatory protein RecX [Spirochaetaceae bacterium]
MAVLTREGSSARTFYVARELLAEAALRPGDRVAEAALADLQRRSEAVLARRRALALLARAMHSRRALARKLTQGGFGSAAVEQALARLDELGYLDDAGYARLWVRSRVARGADGRGKVLAGLLQHGISRRDAAAALDAEYPPDVEAELCRELARRLLVRHARDRRAGERVARQLAGRGFSARLVVDALSGAAPGGGDYAEME